MWVNFEPEVLKDESSFHLIDAMFIHFMDERHHLTQTSMDLILDSEWYQQDPDSKRSQRVKEDVKLLNTQSAYDTPATKMSITVTKNNVTSHGPRLSPRDALETMYQKALVLVENSAYDGDAFDTILHAFQQSYLIKAKKDRYWAWDHMGGTGSLKMRLDKIRQENLGPIRVLVLTDSDRMYPKHESKWEKQVEKICHNKKVKYHILAKREIENYLPLPILQRWAGNNRSRRSYLAVFKALSRNQKDFFDMKFGIPKATSNDDEHKKGFLKEYEDLPPHNRRKLSSGFGKDIIGQFNTQRAFFNKDMIKNNCPDHSDEMEQIFQKILEIL